MRGAFVSALLDQAARDDGVALLTGDLGYSVLEPFAERHPERFVNVGVAEQNMVALASGLALAGMTPFTYSIATFASMRPYEFIRNGPVLHDLPVRMIGIGDGFDYGTNGPTHHALEDVAILRVQPGLAVVVPADAAQTAGAMRALEAVPGPAYLRLGKRSSEVPGLAGRFELGRAALIGSGSDLAIVSYGPITAEAVRTAELLAGEGVDTTVAVAASVQPPPLDDLAELLVDVPAVLTVESHYLTGGIGAVVAELIAERGLGCRLTRAAITAMPRGDAGSPEYLRRRHGLDAPALAATARRALEAVAGGR